MHDWLARKSYWAGEMPRAVFDRAVRNSLCFGALERGATVGFTRVISDRATFAYVSDVFVDPARRGTGISKALMAAVSAHPELQDLRLWVLATADAHGLYAKYGFNALAAPQRYMERRDAGGLSAAGECGPAAGAVKRGRGKSAAWIQGRSIGPVVSSQLKSVAFSSRG